MSTGRPRRWLPFAIGSGAVLILLCCIGVPVAFFLGGLDGSPSDNTQPVGYGCGLGGPIDPDDKLPTFASLGEDQVHNAAIIINVGSEMSVPPRGWVIAIATALQESYLRNLPNLGARNDHDSLGLFQQRPSTGWGTPEQIMDPRYASTKFYEKLLKINGWQSMALTDAAQKVQVSAYPDAYAKHESLASEVVNRLADGAARAVGSLVNMRCANTGEISASGWTIPVRGSIVSGFRTASRPSHQGVDLGVGKGTPVLAAADGVVMKVRCGAVAPDGSNWGCHRDGGVNIKGCGWYVDIMHAGSVITRYCHMVTQPLVSPGQRVAAGQQIGLSGSTGHSSGPHLHFEVHLNGDSGNGGAVNPIEFMAAAGAPLGAAG